VTLRMTAIIAGAIGLLMVIAGLAATSQRADREVTTSATLDTAVVVIEADVVALQGLERITVTSDGSITAHTARAVDATAWLKKQPATYVTGYQGWDALATRTESRVVVPTLDPSASASASASPSPAAPAPASPSASPSATASPDDAGAQAPVADYGSTDDWRASWKGVHQLSVEVPVLNPGETFVAYSNDGADLNQVQFTSLRQVNDGWVSPLLWIGAALTGLGALAALSGLIDTRPAQAKAEAWVRGRSVKHEKTVRPGSRRERRLAGSTVPPATLDDGIGKEDEDLLTTHEWDVPAVAPAAVTDAPQTTDAQEKTETPKRTRSSKKETPAASTKEEGGAL